MQIFEKSVLTISHAESYTHLVDLFEPRISMISGMRGETPLVDRVVWVGIGCLARSIIETGYKTSTHFIQSRVSSSSASQLDVTAKKLTSDLTMPSHMGF